MSMERRPLGRVVREQYLRVEEAKQHAPPKPIRAITLERKHIRMSEGSKSKTEPQHQPQPSSDQPVATKDTPGPFSASLAPSPASEPISSATSIPPSPTSVSPTASKDGTKLSSPSVLAPATSPVAAPFVPPRSPKLSPRLGHRPIGPTLSVSPTQVPSPSSSLVPAVPAASTTTAAVTVPTSATATVQASPVVGGKRPLGEESPIIILIEPREEEEEKDNESRSPHLPEVQDSTRKLRQELTKQEPHKPDPSTSQVSTLPSPSSPERGRETERGRPGVQFSLTTPKRDVAHVMEFFQEQEKSLQESFLSLPKRSVRKQRSPSPHVLQAQPSMGLEHLDNLIKLMEQLTSLKDENSRLRKRCDYLESTKVLLQAKQDLGFDSSSSSSGFMTLPSQKSRQHHHRHYHPGRSKHGGDHLTRFSSEPGSSGGATSGGGAGRMISRPRLSSADELEYLEMVDSSSDQRPKRAKSAMHKRSFSTGSLEVPSDLLDEMNGVEGRKRMKSKTGRSIFGGKHSGSKQKSKSSKWARVKKVLTGQKLYEDLGTTIRSLRELGKSTHVRYSTPGMHTSASDTYQPSSRTSAVDPRHSVYDGGLGDRAPLSLAPSAEPGAAAALKSVDTDPDLTSEIWMGPPDWWEDYEAQKESGGTSTNSEVSSVIEVTTMYLGKKDAAAVSGTNTSSPLTSGSTSSPMTTSATSTSSVSSGVLAGQERYLSVDTSLPRRQSSPSLSAKDGTEEDDLLDDLTLVSESSSRFLHKSSSCKSADLDLPKELSISPKSTDGRESKKFHKTAWGRVKDIIHTRKDSIKKKPKREKSGIDSEETSEVDMEGLLEDQWRSDSFGDGFLSRSTPKTSPTVMRQTSKSISESPPGAVGISKPGGGAKASLPVAGSPGNVDMAALLAGSVSDEFTRKMQEWEEKRARKSRSIRASMDDSEMGSVDVSSASHEFPVRTMDLRDLRGKVPDSASEGPTPEESNTSMEVLGAPSINVEEMQRRMTDSFSRKMQEWERLKYKGSPIPGRDTSPEIERKGSKGRKDDRQKSKRSREEKEKEKWERQRERDKQKVEKEQVKLEKEKLRIEKERLRALEREAKLEKLKGRLSQSEMDPGFKNPVLSPLAEYKVTADFARKLHEWELMKGLSHDVSNSIYLEAQKMSMEHLRETGQQLDALSKQEQVRLTLEGGVREGARSDDKDPPPPVPPLTLQPYWDSPEDTSPVEKYSEASLADDDTCTSVTEECLTKSNIATMERANTQLLGELQRKEMEYAAVQEEVTKVNEKLARVREEHAKEMARFHRELAQGEFTGPVKLEVGELETTMGELEEKIKLMENFGEKLALSMESAAVGKWQSIEGEEAVHTQLVELVDQMRGMLIQATQSEEASQKSSALSNFETLYSQAMKLQVQMNNLRLSHLERNREIMVIKRQLLLQEVNNLLLQADITRRETELYQFHEARRFASLKKWNTFGGTDRQRPQAQMELAAAAARSCQRKDGSGKMTEPRVNIPYIAEDVILASAASSSLSAPASPSAIAAAGGAPMAPSPTHSSSMAASRERSTDHVESHLLTPPSAARGGTWEVHQTAQTTTRGEDAIKAAGRLPPLRSTLQLPTHTTSTLRVQTSPSLTPSPYSSATPSPLSSPALDTTPTTPVSPNDTLELSTTLTTSEPETAVPVPGEGNVKESSSKSEEEQVDQQRKKSKSSKPEFVTICDSAPLHKEIEELKRAKSKVARGSPTLKKSESVDSSPVPSPGKSSRQGSLPESPDQSIPKQRSLDKPRLFKAAPIIDDDYSPTQSVMECTDTSTIVEQAQSARNSDLGAVGGTDLLPPLAEHRREQLPPTSDQSRPGSRSPRSPVSKQKLLRRQREERETKLKDYKAISPKGSPIATRGKPPLPRQTTPVRQSPSASPASEKGPRSKSVGDMEPGPSSESSTPKPLQDTINKFEKRATVCETEDRPIELRKTPSPILHLPRVGLVSRVRRLKPAAELLEESQRYRSGHSIYATRIFQKYITKDEKAQHSTSPSTNKENVSGSYVQAIVQRLSRETTPVGSAGSSRTNSNLSLHRTEGSTRTHSELVSTIVRQLSTGSGPDSPKSGLVPLKDLTNDGQVKQMSQTFGEHAIKSSPERTLSETDIDRPQGVVHRSTTSTAKSPQRKSCEVAMVLTSSTSPTSEAPYEFISALSSSSVDGRVHEEPAAGPSNHLSLPTLIPSTSGTAKAASAEGMGRGRAATYSTPEEANRSSETSGHSGQGRKSSEESKKGKSKAGKRQSKSRERKGGESGRLTSSSLSPERGGAGRGKMGTVGVLCKQSISFDLGVSLYSQKAESSEDPRKPRSWDPSESVKAEAAAAAAAAEADVPSPSSPSGSSHEARPGEPRPVSSSSEGDGAPSSPTSEEKKKSRRFLDSNWLQKSKKFFKVSK